MAVFEENKDTVSGGEGGGGLVEENAEGKRGREKNGEEKRGKRKEGRLGSTAGMDKINSRR